MARSSARTSAAWNLANTARRDALWHGMEKNTLLIGSGETYEWLIDFGQQKLNSTYTRPAPKPAMIR